MQPLIVKYSDFSSASVHKIQPRFEPMKTFKRKRRYQSDKIIETPDSHISFFKASDKFSSRPLFLLDASLPEKKIQKKEPRPCSGKKPKVDNLADYSQLDWNFKPLSKHREGWLFSLNKPETEFTPKEKPKKIPISYPAVVLKNQIEGFSERNDRKEIENLNYSNNIREDNMLDDHKDDDHIGNQEKLKEMLERDQERIKENQKSNKEKSESIKENENSIHEEKKLNPHEEKKSIQQYYSNILAQNENFLSEYKSQYINSNTAKALADLRKDYNLK